MATELTSQDLLAVVHDPRSAVDLERYFVGTNGALASTGSRVESLCGGGDREETANLIAADDLVAVQLLSVNVPQLAALALLEGPLARAVTEQLSLIRTDVDLGTPAAADALAPGVPARKAYTLLESPHNIGWVTATKLLARKRPRLVPVYDRVVRCAVGASAGPWWWFHERFAENNYELATVLRELRLTVGCPTECRRRGCSTLCSGCGTTTPTGPRTVPALSSSTWWSRGHHPSLSGWPDTLKPPQTRRGSNEQEERGSDEFAESGRQHTVVLGV